MEVQNEGGRYRFSRIPKAKELRKRTRIRDGHHIFSRVQKCTRMGWNENLEYISKDRTITGSNIIDLVSGLYDRPEKRLKGDVDFLYDLESNRILPKAMEEEYMNEGQGNIEILLLPYRWIDTCFNCRGHWKYFEVDDDTPLDGEAYWPIAVLFEGVSTSGDSADE
jgi:hypothetical protein